MLSVHGAQNTDSNESESAQNILEILLSGTVYKPQKKYSVFIVISPFELNLFPDGCPVLLTKVSSE